MERLEKIRRTQHEFQLLVGYPIDSRLDTDKNEMAEKYIFKMIEEAIELRKEFPSMMNPYAKNQKDTNLVRVKEEMSDVFLFFVNLLLVWDISFDELCDYVESVQKNNIDKVKSKL